MLKQLPEAGAETHAEARRTRRKKSRRIFKKESVEKLAPVHSKQVLTYLRLMNLPVGLLINFVSTTSREGLHRIVNTLPTSASPRLRVNQSHP